MAKSVQIASRFERTRLPVMIPENRASIGTIAMLYAPVVVAVLVWSLSLPAGIIMGDDLRLIFDAQHGGFGGSFAKDLAPGANGIFRPVLGLVLNLLVSVFGTHFAGYRAVDIAVEIVNSCLVAFLAFVLSGRRLIIGIAAGLAFALSLFSYYTIAQVYGVMEGLALTMTLLIVADVYRSYTGEGERPLLRCILWFALAVGLEERSFVVLPFLMLAIMCAPFWMRADVRRRALLSALPLAVPILWFAIRQFFVSAPLIVVNGHGVQSSSSQFLTFAGDGVLNLFGFIVGPAYLATADFQSVGIGGILTGIAMTLALIVPLVFGAIAAARTGSLSAWRVPLLAVAFIVPELMSASIGSRQEFRWLYNAYAGLLLTVAAAWGAKGNGAERWSIALSVIFIGGTLGSAIVYRPFVGNLYLFHAQAVASKLLADAQTSGAKRMILIDGGDRSIYNWDIGGGDLFALYGDPGVRVDDFESTSDPSLDEAIRSGAYPAKTDVELYSGGDVVHANYPFFAALLTDEQLRPRYSFTDRYDSGIINAKTNVPTPNHQGAFLIDWPAPIVNTFHSLTVIAGYAYTYPRVTLSRGAALDTWVADPYAIGSGSRAIITLQDGRGKRSELFKADLLPADAKGTRWQHVMIDLSRFQSATVSITFRAEQRTGDGTAAWVAFASPRIVIAPHE